MNLFGKRLVISESTWRNLCLLPGVLGLVYVLVADGCKTRQRTMEPPDSSASTMTNKAAGVEATAASKHLNQPATRE